VTRSIGNDGDHFVEALAHSINKSGTLRKEQGINLCSQSHGMASSLRTADEFLNRRFKPEERERERESNVVASFRPRLARIGIRLSAILLRSLAKLSERPSPLFAAVYIAVYRYGERERERERERSSKLELGFSEASIAERASARTREQRVARARVHVFGEADACAHLHAYAQPVGKPSVATNFEFISLRRYKRHKSLL